ncbi:iron(III) transport system ATP-binding protein [Sphaerotilus hippei]|uniref:Iron(III) transport system ATP-binding protein n=1 Tax=Sphaerotilus hippei TaxID=744406 RepID=A0A318H2V7_9BURK|nr:putative 2-aminoethylphosphonate ABC transporter ATP-binding protein [Sphaerotilus hippei]PXW95209.1 iron(III) transport system ATP-binding protein [Sphaerotilus hippei]
MSHLQIQHLHKRFGAFTALDDLSLSVARGEFVVLLGPSGCGKTTLLRTIAGLEHQDSGQIVHAGRDISRLSPAERDYGIVFQSYALFPNLDVGQNVAYGLNRRRAGREAHRQRVDEMLALVGLPGTEDKYPSQLSGGQQQRIALARALATRPDLLLLDEPLSALDAIERVRLRSEIRKLQQTLGVTTIMVTHDQEEALSMADRVVVMRSGRIQQVGTPQGVYHAPSNDFVADFIGRSNLIDAQASDEHHVRHGGLTLHTHAGLVPGRRYRFNVRPEDISLLDGWAPVANSFHAHADKCEFLGAFWLVTLTPVAGGMPPIVAQFSSNYLAGRPIQPGALLRLAIPAGKLLPMQVSA